MEEIITYGEFEWQLESVFNYNNPFPKNSLGDQQNKINTYDKLLTYKNILKNGSKGKLVLYVEKTIRSGTKYKVRRS